MTVQMRAGVGDGQPNHPEDVALVQLLVNGTEFGEVPVTAVFDAATRNAVGAFQQDHFGFTDHIISPGDIGFYRLLGSPIADPTLEAQRDMMLRAMVVHFAQGSAAGFGDVPLNFIRPTADGFGMAGQWVVENSAVGMYSHPRFGTWDVQGAILVKYRELGEEGGQLGNPISGERHVAPGAVSWFENGSLVFSAADGSVSLSPHG